MRHDTGDVERALAVMREALTDWQGMLKQETGPARRAMQALLKGRLAFTPQECDGERFYTFEGEGTISPVIAGTAGLQRVWWPQGDLAYRRVTASRHIPALRGMGVGVGNVGRSPRGTLMVA